MGENETGDVSSFSPLLSTSTSREIFEEKRQRLNSDELNSLLGAEESRNSSNGGTSSVATNSDSPNVSSSSSKPSFSTSNISNSSTAKNNNNNNNKNRGWTRGLLTNLRAGIAIGLILHIFFVLKDGYNSCSKHGTGGGGGFAADARAHTTSTPATTNVATSSSSSAPPPPPPTSLCGNSGSREVRLSHPPTEAQTVYIAKLHVGAMERLATKNATLRTANKAHADLKRLLLKDGEYCALNFFGLPRSFISLTLPSIIEHILIPNVQYECHVFVAYQDKRNDTHPGAGVAGGSIDPDEILLLEEAMRQVGRHYYNNQQYEPTIKFCKFDETDFVHSKWGSTYLNQTRTQLSDDGAGELAHLPRQGKSRYKVNFDQIDNILRMWYSQQIVWNMLEYTQATTLRQLSSASSSSPQYTRAAMFRSDHFFMTPIDIFEYRIAKETTNKYNVENDLAWYPDTPSDPMMETMMIGPARAVKAWAGAIPEEDHWTLMQAHLKMDARKNWWHGMYLPIYSWWTLVPAMERQDVMVVPEERISYARVRAGERVLLGDLGRHLGGTLRVLVLGHILGGRNCVREVLVGMEHYHCPLPDYENLKMAPDSVTVGSRTA